MGKAGSLRWMVVVALVAVVLASCGRSSPSASGSAAERLQAAAKATADAHGFTVAFLPSVDVTYQAPDRFQQVEHGQAQGASGSTGGPSSTSGTFDLATTKVYIGNQYYEGDAAAGDTPVFNVATRCAKDQNAAEYILSVLRALSTATDVTGSGDSFTFHIPAKAGSLVPTSGTVTISGGFVHTVTFAFEGQTPTMTIGSVNHAPPVTAPASASPMNYSCSP